MRLGTMEYIKWGQKGPPNYVQGEVQSFSEDTLALEAEQDSLGQEDPLQLEALPR